MADPIKCPVCGEVNPPDLEFCQNCQSRLQPLTGPLKGEDAPLHPGQAPTKKVTSELEPILPQWLRNARQQARQSAEEEATKAEPIAPVSQGSDLLAGLASQSKEEDEETPDWLTGITGAPAKKKKPEPEDTQVKWVELGPDVSGPQQRSSGRAEESAVLPWMNSSEPVPERDELKDWFSQASSASVSDQRAAPAPSAESAPRPSPSAGTEQVEWFKNLEVDASAFEGAPPEQPPLPRSESPDWLKNLDRAASTYEQASPRPAGPPAGESNPPGTAPLDGQTSSRPADVPDWLKNVGAGPAAAASPGALPDWLSSGMPQAVQPEPPSAQPSAPAETPDWLSSLRPVERQPSRPDETAAPVFAVQEPPAESPSATPAFTDASSSSGDIDTIFSSMQIPDWLSNAAAPGQSAVEENLPLPVQGEEVITPAELPSWVQAMRPVGSAMPDATADPMETSLEMQGPLEGLHGVLPSMPGFVAPSSKPKAHSIKLNATDEQQANASLLEQILSAETAPLPMKAGSVLASQRLLRWTITGLLLFVLALPIFSGTQIFPLPGGVPSEALSAIQAVEAVPADAPVLVIFDYEPSTVGELEAAAGPLMDHLLLLKHPHLALVSTSPTGSALAERFMSTILADRSYQRDGQYVDLGFLPGGLAGVYDFSQNPTVVLPFGADSTLVWQSPLMQGVTHLSDFAAMIVLTDNAESGRVWIEQAGLFRGTASLVIVSSAQAGPMLLPYVQSGQVNGLVAGLNGATGVEQANGGRPGFVRDYWDAYSLGLLMAVAMIVVGGLWNFALGWQARAQEAG